MGPGYSFQDHLGAQSCGAGETLRYIAILNPILDLTTRFLLPLKAGWGAVPLVGEACDQPGGICLGCDGVAKGQGKPRKPMKTDENR